MRRALLLLSVCATLAVPAFALAGPPASGPDTVAPPPAEGEGEGEGDGGGEAIPSGSPTLVQDGPAREFLWFFLPGVHYSPGPRQLVLFDGEQLCLKVRPLSLTADPGHPMRLDAPMVRRVPDVPRTGPGLARLPEDAGAGAEGTGPSTAGAALEVTLDLAPRAQGPHPTITFFLGTEMHEVAGARSPAGDADRAPISGAGFLGVALRF